MVKNSLWQKGKVALWLITFSIILFVLLFVPAGTFKFWEAWVYFALFLSATIFLTVYAFNNSPQLLERRLRRREKLREQKHIQRVNTLLSVIGFIVPGIDHRFDWSHVPANIVLLADIMIVLGYLLIFLVFQENAYASSVIEVEEDQKVVTTGMYSIIRHPMYLGAIIMLSFVPLALGSYWALIPFLLMDVLVVLRLLNEEEYLQKELPGYREYMQETPYRLVPYVW